MTFSDADRRQIEEHGLDPSEVEAQIERFRVGFPALRLDRPATAGDGIRSVSDSEEAALRERFERASADGRAMKFVPASGAASRMFHCLLAMHARTEALPASGLPRLRKSEVKEEREFAAFVDGLDRLALRHDLERVLRERGFDLRELRTSGHLDEILRAAFDVDGLDLAALPKGLVPFHAYPDGEVRTAFEEHLVEGRETVRDASGRVRLHFTVAPARRAHVERHLEHRSRRHQAGGTRFEIEYSVQSPATDTLAVDSENRPLRDDGCLVFRPGGHGALIRNLDALGGDLVLIKNIDNIVPDWAKDDTTRYKALLGGVLLETQDQIFDHVRELEGSDGAPPEERLGEMRQFVEDRLCHQAPRGTWEQPPAVRGAYLRSVLDRPLRVCGMVRNEGEPGGGPFWVRQVDGSVSLQIVEQAQVDPTDPGQADIFQHSTHFNPVDLVCGLRDAAGRPYELRDFVDPETGLIATKSKDGVTIKALELPGLWNGSMARWNTVFVEVPLSTFNPVKTILDLLREAHRSVPAPRG